MYSLTIHMIFNYYITRDNWIFCLIEMLLEIYSIHSVIHSRAFVSPLINDRNSAGQSMNEKHQSRRFRLNCEIIWASVGDSPGAIAPRKTFIHETRYSKGILWSVSIKAKPGEGLMKTKDGGERTVVRAISASSPRGISGRVGCLFAGSFLDRGISPRSWKTAKNSSRRLIVVVFFPVRRKLVLEEE